MDEDAHLPADSNSECALAPGTAFDNGHFATQVAARTVEDLVRVTVLRSGEAIVGMASDAVMGMSLCHFRSKP